MVGHKFTDDVAVCKAISKSQAIKQFSKYYSDVKVEEVDRLKPRKYSAGSVIILTDY